MGWASGEFGQWGGRQVSLGSGVPVGGMIR